MKGLTIKLVVDHLTAVNQRWVKLKKTGLILIKVADVPRKVV